MKTKSKYLISAVCGANRYDGKQLANFKKWVAAQGPGTIMAVMTNTATGAISVAEVNRYDGNLYVKFEEMFKEIR